MLTVQRGFSERVQNLAQGAGWSWPPPPVLALTATRAEAPKPRPTERAPFITRPRGHPLREAFPDTPQAESALSPPPPCCVDSSKRPDRGMTLNPGLGARETSCPALTMPLPNFGTWGAALDRSQPRLLAGDKHAPPSGETSRLRSAACWAHRKHRVNISCGSCPGCDSALRPPGPLCCPAARQALRALLHLELWPGTPS